MDSVDQIVVGCVVAFIGFVAGTLYQFFGAKVGVMFRRMRASYPRELASAERIDMSEFLDAMRHAGTRVRDWNAEAPIIGLNRGGAILAGFIAKQLGKQNIGLISFAGERPELLLPSKFDKVQHPAQIVLVDDQFNSGETAQQGIRLLTKHFGDDVRIFFISLTSKSFNFGTNDEDVPGTGKGLAVRAETSLFLFLPKNHASSRRFKLPWDLPKFREKFGD